MHISNEIIKQLQESPDFRRELTERSFFWFFITYFTHYVTCPTAKFHEEIFALLQEQEVLKVAITAFRGSAKSTIASLAYPIWSIVGKPSKKYTLLVSQTQELSKQILTNIKQELSTNKLLIRDFGPFITNTSEWKSNSLVIKKYNSRISAISQGESIRGIRHRQYRPDNIVIDDVEDLESVKNRESRTKLWNWFVGEVVPVGDVGTKIIIIGNLLHEDSLMMKLKKNINSKKMNGVYREYPLIDNEGKITWKGKYPTIESINTKRKEVADDSAWYREFLLKFIADNNRIVQKKWIKYWTEMPNFEIDHPRIVGIGTDVAISQKSTADYTAIVPFFATGYGNDLKIYILDYIVNERLNFTDTISKIREVRDNLKHSFKIEPVVYVEAVGYQESLTQQLNVEKIFAESVAIRGLNKEVRLKLATPYMRMGKVLFPKSGAEILIEQLVNFGIEKYDDLVDAFTIITLKVLETDEPTYNSRRLIKSHPPILKRCKFTGTMSDCSKMVTAGLNNKEF